MVHVDDRLILHNIEGTHAGINEVTGDISLQAEGYLVENGKIVKALNMIILSTSIFELFSNVLEVGSDLREFNPYFAAPSILADNITISGEN